MSAKLSGPMLAPLSGGSPKRLMVLLHGYGSDGADVIGLGQYWREHFPDMGFVAPNAPALCAINAAGFEWFPVEPDRTSWGGPKVAAARAVITGFLGELWAQSDLGPSETFLGGFSQGAMMALNAGLSLDQNLAGIVAFSGALLPLGGLGQRVKPPVCLVHGDHDQVVDPAESATAARRLAELGFDVSYHVSIGVGHRIAPDGLDFATRFMLAKSRTRA